MNERHHQGTEWFVRREGVIRGPFTEVKIKNYLLLGRVLLTDELSQGGVDWLRASHCEELVPDLLRLAPTPENQQRLLEARMLVDERSAGDRRAREPNPPAEIRERRTGRERRKPEPVAVLRFREIKSCQDPGQKTLASLPGPPFWRYVLLLLLLIGLLYWVLQP